MKNSSKLCTKWLTNMSAEDKEKFTELLNSQGGQRLLERLQEIVEQQLKGISRPNRDAYETGSWAYLQAHHNGMQEAYETILQLTDHVNKG